MNVTDHIFTFLCIYYDKILKTIDQSIIKRHSLFISYFRVKTFDERKFVRLRIRKKDGNGKIRIYILDTVNTYKSLLSNTN